MDIANRRQNPRFETQAGVMLFTKESKIEAQIVDVSEGGIGMVSEKTICLGTKIYTSLKFVDEYALKGTIIWALNFSGKQTNDYRLGLEIESIIVSDMMTIGFAPGYELVAKLLCDKKRQGVFIKEHNSVPY